MIFRVVFLCLLGLAKSTVIVEGTIVSYDVQNVVLKQESGALLTVPRKLLPRQKGIRVGSDKVKIELSPADFARLNQKILKKK